MTNEKEVLVKFQNVDIAYKRGGSVRKVVEDFTLNIYKGEILGLVGESGSGKTTIGRTIARLIPTHAGEITYEGERISGKISSSKAKWLKTQVQMIYQDPGASLNERANVDFIVSEGLRAFHMFENEQDRLDKISNILRKVGLIPEQHLKRFPHEFSGGQRQRIGIARSMVMNPKFIIADEPISALDVSIRAQVLNLIQEFKDENDMTVLFIAHDLSVVKYISDRIVVIYGGKIVEIAPSDELFNLPLHLYTQALLTAVPIPDPNLERNKEIKVFGGFEGKQTTLVEVGPHHYVRGTDEEIKNFKDIYKRYHSKKESK